LSGSRLLLPYTPDTMRRWNGWGSDTTEYPLSSQGARFLEGRLGPGAPMMDAGFAEVLRAVPPSRLPAHSLVSAEPAERATHARGQSLPDWLALRSGRITTFPDGVAYPATREQVRELLGYARDAGARIIPYGGGTSVVGHINPLPGDAPVLTLDMSRMQRLLHLSRQSQLATFEAGVRGPALEANLRAHGYTLGHFPQSFELSTLGGWVATRSSGQQSLGYGRIEQLFAGGRMESPIGTLAMPPFPASSAGPDLRQLVLGSEGRLGILTEAAVRITPLPEREEFHAVFFPDWGHALAAARQIAQARLPISLIRLSSPAETATNLALAGHARAVSALEQFLSLRGARAEKCMLLLGFTGTRAAVDLGRNYALHIAGQHKGVNIGQALGKQWRKSRFKVPYLRNTLWDMGYAVDTVETVADWDRVPALAEGIELALRGAIAGRGERVHITTHLSHLYPTGSSVYVTYVFRIAPDPEETEQRWRALKGAASQAIIANGGTISHQHGVGTDHLPYLQAEKGSIGIDALCAVCRQFDPTQMMNPGKLVG